MPTSIPSVCEIASALHRLPSTSLRYLHQRLNCVLLHGDPLPGQVPHTRGVRVAAHHLANEQGNPKYTLTPSNTAKAVVLSPIKCPL